MARRVERVKKLVTEPSFRIEETVILTCDKCGTDLGDEDYGSEIANVLEIYCNLDYCVNDRVRMDLCNDCLGPIWGKICNAIGADPADNLNIGQDD